MLLLITNGLDGLEVKIRKGSLEAISDLDFEKVWEYGFRFQFGGSGRPMGNCDTAVGDVHGLIRLPYHQ